MSDATNRALLMEYKKAQSVLQVAAISGRNADEETVRRFSQLSDLLYMNHEVAQYLLAQLRMQKVAGEICQRIMDAAGLEVQLPGM